MAVECAPQAGYARPMGEAPDHAGHRARLRTRLLGEPEGMADYELVEYLLALAIPRRDTKPLAKRLLDRFGGIPALVNADPAEIARVDGAGDASIAALKIAHAVAIRLLKIEAEAKPVLGNWQALLDYLRASMAHHGNEQFRVLHLNTRNMLIRDETMGKGSIDEAPVYVREVIRRAMDLKSAAIILVHNHPSGDPSPSRADIDMTRSVIDAGKRLGIAVHDHIIIGMKGFTSLRGQGLI